MPKSKHRARHREKLDLYKSTKKKEQELFKKKMIDNYIKMQQDALANQESHTSTQEVSGPDINIDALNEMEYSIIEDMPVIENMDQSIIDVEPIIELPEDPLVGGYVRGLDGNGNLMKESFNQEENDNNN